MISVRNGNRLKYILYSLKLKHVIIFIVINFSVNIFEEKADQDLLGMTRQSGACDSKRQAVLIEDVGLLAGIVIAHEIGHS